MNINDFVVHRDRCDMSFSSSSTTSLWERGLFQRQPRWPHEPDAAAIIALSRQHLHIVGSVDINVNLLAQGAFNKLYTISSSGLSKDYLFRVTLPVEPSIKTASEVATLLYLRRHTKLPVPQVVAHAITSDNELGYEWMIMERLPGVCLKDIWPVHPGEKGDTIKLTSPTGSIECSPVDWKAKEDITRTISGCVQDLRSRSFKAIGSLYCRSDLNNLDIIPATLVETDDPEFVIGPLVSLRLFYGDLRSRANRNLGPYSSEREYISAWADVQRQELELAQRLDPEDPLYDEDLVDDGPEIKSALDALCNVIPNLFSPHNDPNAYTLYHNDLSLANVIVDPTTFKVTGIVDWECIGTVPRWEDEYPQFLYGIDVDEEPDPWEEDDATNLARAELWENWEKVKLRKLFSATASTSEEEEEQEDRVKREFVGNLEEVVIWHRRAENWVSTLSPKK